MSETSRRVLHNSHALDALRKDDKRALALEVEALEVERDAALAKLAEVERERDRLRACADGRHLDIVDAAAEHDTRLALAEKVCEAAARAIPLASPFPEVETALDAWRAAKDSSGGVAAPAEALAKLAEVERERDALRDDLLAQVQGSTSTLKAVNACLDSVSARLALAEKVCDAVLPHVGWHGTTCDYHRDDCPQAALPEGCAACSIDSALNAALSAWRAAKDSTGSGVEGVEDAPGEAPEPGRATSLRGGHGPSYTRAEVDAAIAQAKREVVEVVLAAWSDATASLLGSGWSLDPRRFTAALRKAASRG